MIKSIISIVMRNVRNTDKMTIELINFLAKYSSTANRLRWFLSLDERYDNHSMIVENGHAKVTYTWANVPSDFKGSRVYKKPDHTIIPSDFKK